MRYVICNIQVASNKARGKSGFTLMEMLIVIAVIALLASMVVGIAGRIDSKGKERLAESTFSLLEGALQEYYQYRNEYPAAPATADPNVNCENLYARLRETPGSQKILEYISNSLIQNRFGDANTPPEIYDPWGTVLNYVYDPASGNLPKLISAGPDKIPGSADDIIR